MTTGLFYFIGLAPLELFLFPFVPVAHRAEVAADAAVNLARLTAFTHGGPPPPARPAAVQRQT